jgi:hypothetical protein
MKFLVTFFLEIVPLSASCDESSQRALRGTPTAQKIVCNNTKIGFQTIL